MKRTMYHTCPLCGSNLDSGEKCDCQDEKERERQKIQGMLAVGKGGQLRMLLEQGVSGIAENIMA